jgi:outer membrane protein OmpA-like peptidoglycan-associated protein
VRPAAERVIGVLGLAALSTAFASSCSAPPRTDADARSAVRSSKTAVAGHIAQLDFNRRTAFATCLPPACPAVTRKTLADEVPPMLPTPRQIELGASLDSGEAIVASNTRPSIQPAPVAAPKPERDAEPMTKQVVVHFGFGSAALSPAARASIDEAASALSSARRIAVSGRTDSVGPPEINQALALDRANAVRDHLRARYPHLAPAVTLEAKGVCCFAAPNDTAQGRALNRRVEVVFERDAEDL